jgi:hypothetical protein
MVSLVAAPIWLAMLTAGSCPLQPDREVIEGEPVRHVTLGEDATLWWHEVPPMATFTDGAATADANAKILADDSAALHVDISAQAGTISGAVAVCEVGATFTVDPDPTLSPDTMQAVLGTVVVELAYSVTGGPSNYELWIEFYMLEFPGFAAELSYSYYPELPQNNPVPGIDTVKLQVEDVMFEAGCTYHIILRVYGDIGSTEDPPIGGRLWFEGSAAPPQILFGISPSAGHGR